MKVPEGLLLGQKSDVVFAGILDKLLNFRGSEGGLFRGYKRLSLEVENVFHVEPEQVDLVFSQRANLGLQVVDSRNGTAADVVGYSAPLHAGPVADDQRGNGERLCCRAG